MGQYTVRYAHQGYKKCTRLSLEKGGESFSFFTLPFYLCLDRLRLALYGVFYIKLRKCLNDRQIHPSLAMWDFNTDNILSVAKKGFSHLLHPE